MDFKDRLRELRKASNMTMQELADALGVSKALIGMYETGRRNPGYEMEEALADLFNVSIDFLRGSEDRSPFFLDEKQIALQQAFDKRPEMRMLFSTVEDCSAEEIQQAIKIIEALKK